MTAARREDVTRAPSPFAERVGARPTRTVWCCTCDGPPDIGPHNHFADHPDHYIVEAVGEFHVWRNPAAIGEEAALERAHWWNQGAKAERRRTEETLRVLFHVIATNKNFDGLRPNEITDDAIRVGHEFLVDQGWWPPTDRDARIAPMSDSGRHFSGGPS